MAEHRLPPGLQQHAYRIDAQPVCPKPVLGEPQQAELPDLAAFAPRDCLKRIPESKP